MKIRGAQAAMCYVSWTLTGEAGGALLSTLRSDGTSFAISVTFFICSAWSFLLNLVGYRLWNIRSGQEVMDTPTPRKGEGGWI